MQAKKIKKNLLFLNILLFAFAFLVVGGFTGMSRSFIDSTPMALTSGTTSPIKVYKVNAQDKSPDEDYTNLHTSAEENKDNEIIYNGTNIPFVVLNTEAKNGKREAIYITVGEEDNVSYNIIWAKISYNETTQLKTNYPVSKPDGALGETFSQYLHGLSSTFVTDNSLNENFKTKDGDGNVVDFPEGKYTINIKYRLVSDATGDGTEITFSLYLLTDASYSAVAEKPGLDYTEKVTLADDATLSTQHYFKHTNVNTSDKEDVAVAELSSKLYYPELSYNPEKFKISYTRVLYNYKETVNLTFHTTGVDSAERGFLTTTVLNGTVVLSTTSTELVKTDGIYIARVQLDKLGDYVLNKQLLLKIGANNYISASSIITSETKLLKPEALNISGFSAEYANQGNGSAPFKNDEITSDFTYLNPSLTSDNSALSKPSSAPTISDTSITVSSSVTLAFGTLPSTNQAPVWLSQFATLNSTANTSWYIYKPLTGYATVSNFKLNTEFSKAGSYFVYLSFNNSAYASDGSSNNSSGMKYTAQFIAFKITNTAPTVTIHATDETNANALAGAETTTLNSLDYTNKNVFIEWSKPGVFDAPISAKYSLSSFDNRVVADNSKMNGLWDGKVETNDNKTTLFTANGWYTIKVYHTNSEKSFTVYEFTIDKTKLEGIRAVAINTSTGKIDGNVGNNGVISTQNNFNLTTNKPFAWTWASKASGATVTAKYTYASLSNIDGYSNTQLIENDSDEVWVSANGKFGLLSALMDYSYTDTNQNGYKFNPSQIISTARVAILLLSDEAGNTATFVTILDTVEPEMLQQIDGSGESNRASLISQTTKFTWGSHKALGVQQTADTNRIDLDDLLNKSNWQFANKNYAVDDKIKTALTNSFHTYNTQLYFTAQITEATITSSVNNTSIGTTAFVPQKNETTQKWIKTSAWVVVTQKAGSSNWVSYLSDTKEGTALGGNEAIISDGSQLSDLFLTFNCVDNSGSAMSQFTAQVSLDRAQSSMFNHSGSLNNTSETVKDANRMFSENSTNRQYLTFSFLQKASNSIFRVETVVLDFYPLTFDTSAENFPYSDNAITTTLYSINNTTSTVWENWSEQDGTCYHSNALGYLSYDASFKASASQEGMYVFKRSYSSDFIEALEDAKQGDIAEAKYTVFVDRTGVISFEKDLGGGNLTIGGGISLRLGKNTEGYSETPVSFQNWALHTQNSTEFANSFFHDGKKLDVLKSPNSALLRSNILPISIILPTDNYNKYSNLIAELALRNTVNMKIQVIVQRFNQIGELKEQTLYSPYRNTRILSDGELKQTAPISDLVDGFNVEGWYRVMLFDTSNLTGALSGTWNELASYSTASFTPSTASFTPNNTVFTFKIDSTRPSAIAQHKVGDSSEFTTATTATGSTLRSDDKNTKTTTDYITGNENSRFTFSDTTDPYAARIAYNDVILIQTVYGLNNSGAITARAPTSITLSDARTWDASASNEVKRALFSDEEIARINGAVSTNSTLSLSSKDDSGGILYYRVLLDGTTDRYRYYVLLPSTPTTSGYQKVDCQYRLEYHYIGNTEYTAGAGQNATTLYVDKIAPYRNLLALVDSDQYLSDDQKNEIKANLNNPDYEFLKTYAFAIDSTFTFAFTATDPSENQQATYYYRKYSSDKYTDETSLRHQTSVPGRTSLPNAIVFDAQITTFVSKKLTNTEFTQTSGYYDIIERDTAGNHTVYTVFVADSDSGITLEAEGADNITYSMKGTKDGLTIDLIDGESFTTLSGTEISTAVFDINSLINSDAWYSIKYRNVTTNSSAAWNILEIKPNGGLSLGTQLDTLNAWIESVIASGSATTGTRIEIDILNRVGANINFFILSPGQQILLKNYIARIGNEFTFTFVKDSASTKYSNFKIMEDGLPMSGSIINSIRADRGVDHTFTFSAANKYVFSFQDNFGRKYSYTYPTSTGLVSEFVFATNSTTKLIDGIRHTSNNTDFRYTTEVANTELSITITDRDSNTQILSLVGKTYNELLAYTTGLFTISRNSGIATISFKAIYNHHYIYTLDLKDQDGNFTFSESFGIYTKLPSIVLTDTSGIALWEDIFNTNVEKNTSKQVVIKWANLTDPLGINPRITLERNGVKTTISSPYTVKTEGSYIVRIESDLGVLYTNTIKPVSFVIKSYEISVYGVYYNNVLLQAHSDLLEVIIDNVTRKVDHFFFLADTSSAWNNLKVMANENKDLSAVKVNEDGNTQIWRVYGNTSHHIDEYLAITRIPSTTSNSLTTFSVLKYSANDPAGTTGTKANDDKDYILQLVPSNGVSTYANLTWNPSYTDPSNGKVYPNFVYLDLSYNEISIGTFTSGSIQLTESGQYTIKIYDAVGQKHRFGSGTLRDYFTLTLMNNVIFSVNNSSPIQNATYNDQVTISLRETSLYDLNTLTATILLDGQPYTDYTSTSTTWTLKRAGHYKVTLSVRTKTTGSPPITGTLNFTIIDKEESRSIHEFSKISGYTVKSIKKMSYNIAGEQVFQDITSNFISSGNILYNFKLDTTNPGVGRYLITIKTPIQEYSYIVWLNDESPAISPSRNFGTTETSPVTISYNLGLLYQQVGKSYITLNGEVKATVDSTSLMQPESFAFSAPGTYLVQVYSESGNLLLSQRISIAVPLNSAAIALIVLGCLVVVAVIITFVILRTRMRVK